MDGILIPVKQLDEAKQRLSPHLTPSQRVRLSLAMLGDVLAETQAWKDRFLVTRDARASELGRSYGVEIVPEGEAGLNAALALGTRHAVGKGIQRLLVLPADVPAVLETDLRALFSLNAQVCISPSSDGGTTAILRSPPGVMETAFGPKSASAHVDAATRAGVTVRSLELDSLLLDVDDFGDLQRLATLRLNRQSIDLARKLSDRTDQPPAA